MKRVFACLSLILYAAYIAGISLLSYVQQQPLSYLAEQQTVDNYFRQSSELRGKNFLGKFSSQRALPVHSYTVVIGKVKLPCAFSCSIITAGFVSARLQYADNFSIAKMAPSVVPLTPVFLRNCVLRI